MKALESYLGLIFVLVVCVVVAIKFFAKNDKMKTQFENLARRKYIADSSSVKSPAAKALRVVYWILFVMAIIGAIILYTSEDINIILYVIAGGILQGIFVGALASILDYLADLTKTNRDILETLKNKEK